MRNFSQPILKSSNTWEMILEFRTDRRITGVRRGRKRVPIYKGGVEVEWVGVAILLTKREHGIFPSF